MTAVISSRRRLIAGVSGLPSRGRRGDIRRWIFQSWVDTALSLKILQYAAGK
jgi:hypothetical protein